MTREYQSVCAWCGYHHTCTSQITTIEESQQQVEEARLKPDDMTICVRCSGVNVVDHKGRLRRPTPDEAVEMAKDERIGVASYYLAQVQGHRKH